MLMLGNYDLLSVLYIACTVLYEYIFLTVLVLEHSTVPFEKFCSMVGFEVKTVPSCAVSDYRNVSRIPPFCVIAM